MTETQNNKWGDTGALRLAAEALTDVKNLRIRVSNRADAFSRAQTEMSGVVQAELTGWTLAEIQKFEATFAVQLVELYEQVVPWKVRAWASGVPLLNPRVHYKRDGSAEAQGVLFARIVGLTGNPRWAVPLKPEGEGADRHLVPDGEPYPRECTCGCEQCTLAIAGGVSWHCGVRDRDCHGGLQSFWQWCGTGDPDNFPRKNMTQKELLSMGKRTTVRPLLRVYSDMLVRAAARSPAAENSRLYQVYLDARKDGAERKHGRRRLLRAELAKAGVTRGAVWELKRDGKVTVNGKTYLIEDYSEPVICKNTHRPPMKPNGCGTVAHPEWGEPGSPWRPGHINAHAHRIVHKELMRDFWAAAEGTVSE